MPRFQTIATICHDGQFWVAVIERQNSDSIEVARHVFGPEPSNPEVLDWAGRGFDALCFHPAAAPVAHEPAANPKRRKREAAAARRDAPVSRARDALKAAAEIRAVALKSVRAETRRAVAARRYADRVARKKARRGKKGMRSPG